MKKQVFLAAAMLLSAGVLTTACSNEEVLVNPATEGSTHMFLEIGLPKAGHDSRVAQDGQDKPDPDFNHVGEWKGKDKIEKLEVYVFDDQGNLEGSVNTFTAGQFQLVPGSTGTTTTSNNAVCIKPLKGIKTKPGAKTVYVVVNPTANSTALLAGKNTLAAFEAAYASADMAMANTGTADQYSENPVTAASELAKVVTEGTEKKDQILMTGTKGTVTVVDGVTENTTLTAANTNRATVEVTRTVARVLVSATAATFDITGDNPTTPHEVETGTPLGTISNLHFVVGQGERKEFFTKKASADAGVWAYQTPGSAFVPATGAQATYNTAGGDANTATTHYDYAGLWKNTAASTSPVKGVPVATPGLHAANADKINAELDKNVSGEFLLPNTHKFGDKNATEYRKGNTAYVLVRGTFAPKFVTSATGEVTAVADAATAFPGGEDVVKTSTGDVTLNHAAGTFVVGANGLYYKSVGDAQKHNPGMECQVYEGGKVIYFAWINPDVTTNNTGWYNSPVIRNNIYHIEIAGFVKLGANWNPLVPGDPNKPGGPEDPNNPNTGGGDKDDPNKPNNPDPKPNNPFEPKVPSGVDPTDPLTPKETWMSVKTTILPWEVHSYSVQLGN